MCHKTREWTTTAAEAVKLPSCQAKWQLPRPYFAVSQALSSRRGGNRKKHQEHSRKVGGNQLTSLRN